MISLGEYLTGVREHCHCTGKRRFLTPDAAAVAVERIRARPDCYDRDTLTVYACRHSPPHWHVGHKTQDVEHRAVATNDAHAGTKDKGREREVT